MAVMTDEILENANGLPVATVGELRMWNFSAQGLRLDLLPDDFWVTTTWVFGYRVAANFLKEMGLDDAEASDTLLLRAPPGEDVPLEARWRLYDVHRIRIALLVLYPNQPEWQRHRLTTSHPDCGGQVPFELMAAHGTGPVRAIFETWLSR